MTAETADSGSTDASTDKGGTVPTSDASIDAGSDATPLTNDPCNPPINVDCSTTCDGPPSMQCTWGCEAAPQVFKIPYDLPYGIRTPNTFDGETACTTSCPGLGSFPFGIFLDLSAIPASVPVRIRVDAPFFVARADESAARCYDLPASHCLPYAQSYFFAYVFVEPGTTSLVSRNIVIEEIADGAPACP